jgi:hypothetical protein
VASAPHPDLQRVAAELTADDVASFRALRAEVCVESPTLGEVWLVPEYTGAQRREIIPEHAMKVAAILDAFPGARPTEWLLTAQLGAT